MKTSSDALIIGGVELHSRLFIGTGKYGSDRLIPAVAEASGAEVITVALRRVDLGNPKDNVLSHIPGGKNGRIRGAPLLIHHDPLRDIQPGVAR